MSSAAFEAGEPYPVTVTIPFGDTMNRLWGIPFIGLWVRGILVIPQGIALFVLGLIVGLLLLVSWIPILLDGRMSDWGYRWIGGAIRLSIRTTSYVLLLVGRYPPFWIDGDHLVQVTFDEGEEQNRWWGVPILGILGRLILLIPHFVVLWLLGVMVWLLTFFSWIPVLQYGRQHDAFINLIGGTYRYTARVAAYALLLTGTYPPFRLDA